MKKRSKKIFVLAAIVILFFILVPKIIFADINPPSPEELCRSMRLGRCCVVGAGLCIPWDKASNIVPPARLVAAPCSEISECQGKTPTGVILPEKDKIIPPELQVNIPGFQGFTTEEGKIKKCAECKDSDILPEDCPPEQCASWVYEIPWIGEYFLAIYKWSVGAIALLAVIMIMINGVRWMIAHGEAPKIGEAKKGITYAVTGLIFILLTHQILSLIDPRLTIFKPITIGVIKRIEERIGSPGVGVEGQEKVDQYSTMDCPTDEEKRNGFRAVITAYFEPTTDDFNNRRTYGYKSFECMVAIECGCKGGVKYLSKNDPNWILCAKISGKEYGPCEKIDTLTKFKSCCAGVGNKNNQLIPLISLAADQKCFPFGTKIQIIDSGNSQFNKIWQVHDVGGAIKGRRFDLFLSDSSLAQTITEELTAKVVP